VCCLGCLKPRCRQCAGLRYPCQGSRGGEAGADPTTLVDTGKLKLMTDGWTDDL